MDDDMELFMESICYNPNLSLLQTDNFCVGTDAPLAVEKYCQEITS